MSSRYPILDNRPIDQWKVTELKEELKRRKLTTRGLKDELIKRLDESIRSEMENANLTADNGLDTDPEAEDDLPAPEKIDKQEKIGEQEKTEGYVSQKAKNDIDINNDTYQTPNTEVEPQVTSEQEATNEKVSDPVQDTTIHGENASAIGEDSTSKFDMNDTSGLVNEEKIRELEITDGTGSAALETNQVIEVGTEVTTETVTEVTTETVIGVTTETVIENVEPVVSLTAQDLQNKSGNLETEPERDDSLPENDDPKPIDVEDKVNKSDPYNQVSEVNPVLGFEVKSDSISTETVTINEKNELKDNIIADDVKLELDVKREMVQPSSSDDAPEGGKSHPMDVEEPQTNKVSVEDTGGNNAANVDDIKKDDTADLGSEKLNLDRSSGDDFMDEDVIEGKQIDSKSNYDEIGVKKEKEEAPPTKEESHVDIVGEDIQAETKVTIMEEKNGPAASVKRKLNGADYISSLFLLTRIIFLHFNFFNSFVDLVFAMNPFPQYDRM